MARITTPLLTSLLCMFLSRTVLAATCAGLPVSDRIFATGYEAYTLTVDNYLSWCTVGVNGGTSSTAASTAFSFPDNQGPIPLHGAPAPGFIWGHWIGTDFDTGQGDTLQDSRITMYCSDRIVKVCCPFPGGSGCPY